MTIEYEEDELNHRLPLAGSNEEGNLFRNKKFQILAGIAAVLVIFAVGLSIYAWLKKPNKNIQNSSSPPISQGNQNSNVEDLVDFSKADPQNIQSRKEKVLETQNIALDENSLWFQKSSQEAQKWDQNAQLTSLLLHTFIFPNKVENDFNPELPSISFMFSSKTEEKIWATMWGIDYNNLMTFILDPRDAYEEYTDLLNISPDQFGYINFKQVKIDQKEAFRVGTKILKDEYSYDFGPDELTLLYVIPFKKHVWIINKSKKTSGDKAIYFAIDGTTGLKINFD